MSGPAAGIPPCPVCGGSASPWIRTPGRDLLRCRGCGYAWMQQGVLRHASGRTIYEDATPVFATSEQADYYRDDTAVSAARDKLRWVRRFLPRGATVLDVGANFGLFVTAAATELDATGIEPSPAVVEQARAAGARLEVGSIDDSDARFVGRFDAVTLFDVLEHLPDPAAALRRCHEYLKPGGLLFITTPDAGSRMARVLGRHWYYIDMDEHIALFSSATLRRVLDNGGFRLLDRRTIGRRYRLSYIRRRLAFLGQTSLGMRVAHAATLPFVVWPQGEIPLNLGDVMGVVARRI